MDISPAFANRWLNAVHHGDCVDLMSDMPDASVDLIFADPPYNLQIGPEYGRPELRRPEGGKVAGVDESWDKFAGFAEYDAFTQAWLREARRVLKPNGAIWVIGAYHNVFRLGASLQDLGYWVLNDVLWVKTNPMPNFRGRRFTNAHETLIWAARSKDSRHVFNYEAMKTANDGLQMRSDWRIPICGGAERLKDEEGKKAHPTQKPEALLYRVILASTHPGQVVLDPFFGAGTTGAACRRLGRHWIGLEADESYVALAKKRIAETPSPADYELTATPGKRDEPRVPFATLLETGLIRVGETLYGPNRRWTARVRADGQVIAAEHRGSIHAVGAAVQGAPACNGWTFWNVDREGVLCPIDVLRQQVRASLDGTSGPTAPPSDGAKPRKKAKRQGPRIAAAAADRVLRREANVTYLAPA